MDLLLVELMHATRRRVFMLIRLSLLDAHGVSELVHIMRAARLSLSDGCRTTRRSWCIPRRVRAGAYHARRAVELIGRMPHDASELVHTTTRQSWCIPCAPRG
ncbi:hypothetical protein HanPSC8_Chr08g0331031 [Helianthus annuus]|nr:hypothetical protein HanPSC8_Chr08g0331031 [Helianthus annuus]